MSPKELLYIEDALGHGQQIKATCQSSAAEIQDEDLKNFILQIGKRHEECFNSVYNLLK